MVCHQLKTGKQNFSEVTRLKNVTCQLLIDEVYCQSGKSHSGNEGVIGSVFLAEHVASLKVCFALWKVSFAPFKFMLPH